MRVISTTILLITWLLPVAPRPQTAISWSSVGTVIDVFLFPLIAWTFYAYILNIYPAYHDRKILYMSVCMFRSTGRPLGIDDVDSSGFVVRVRVDTKEYHLIWVIASHPTLTDFQSRPY